MSGGPGGHGGDLPFLVAARPHPLLPDREDRRRRRPNRRYRLDARTPWRHRQSLTRVEDAAISPPLDRSTRARRHRHLRMAHRHQVPGRQRRSSKKRPHDVAARTEPCRRASRASSASHRPTTGPLPIEEGRRPQPWSRPALRATVTAVAPADLTHVAKPSTVAIPTSTLEGAMRRLSLSRSCQRLPRRPNQLPLLSPVSAVPRSSPRAAHATRPMRRQ